MCMFVDTTDLVQPVGFSQSSISVCVCFCEQSQYLTSRLLSTSGPVQSFVSLKQRSLRRGTPFATLSVHLSRFVDFFSEAHVPCGSQAHPQKKQLTQALLCMFVDTADLTQEVGLMQSRTPMLLEMCMSLYKVNTKPQDFSALWTRPDIFFSNSSCCSNSDLSVEVLLWRPVRFPSRGFRIFSQKHMFRVARKVI